MGQRPAHVKPPADFPANTPVPEPAPAEQRKHDPADRNPTRYGDWELKGIAIDF